MYSVRCLVAVIPFMASSAVIAEAGRPNLVFILADDLGYGDVGAFGGTALHTPHLDRLAAQGVKLTRHYAGSTVCGPSRCVLLTGKHVGRASVRGNQSGYLADDELTIAKMLAAAGYDTGCFGKWGVGHPPTLDDPRRCGFGTHYGYVNMFHAHNFYPEFLVRDGRKETLGNVVGAEWRTVPAGQHGKGVAVERVDYAPDLITDEAVSFLEASRTTPFFLYLAFNTPHANNEATDSPRPERGMEVPDFGPFSDRPWPWPEKGFAEIVRRLDRDVGRVLTTLDRLGIANETLIIFSSDNGPHSEGGHAADFFDSNGPLRGLKRDLYEGGIRVPTIVRWLGEVPCGTTLSDVSGFQDWLPTIADAAGVTANTECDGISLWPALRGEPVRETERPFYFEFPERGGRRAVRQGKWKAVQYDALRSPPGPVELYDLASDPSETSDVAASHPDVVARLTAVMRSSHTPS
ncbi:MAG: arylsulfatase, partial [Planctomycetota bacterium]